MSSFRFLIPLVALAALIQLGAGCARMDASFREGNPLRNPPAEMGIFVTPFDVKTPYTIVGVVEARGFAAVWSPQLTEEDMHRELAAVAAAQKEKIDAIVQAHVSPYNSVSRWGGLQARGLAIRYQTPARGAQRPEEFFLEGWRAIREERFDDAIVDFLNVIRLDPTISEAHFNLAQLYLDKGQYDRALWHIDTFLKNYPNREQATKGLQLREAIIEHERSEGRVYFWNRVWLGTKTAVGVILAPLSFIFRI